MPAIPRNAPCPCGSGLKYKRCCMRGDEPQDFAPLKLVPAANPVADQETERRDEWTAVAERHATWSVDLVPLPLSPNEGRRQRAALGLVVSSTGTVIVAEPLAPAPTEILDVASAAEALLERAAERTGGWPDSVRVRFPQLRRALAPRLAEHRTGVRTQRRIPALARVHQHFAENVLGLDDVSPLSCSIWEWSQWGAPHEDVAALFAAAREYLAAEPWRLLSDATHARAVVPGGAAWTMLVLGQAGRTYGITLLEQESDIERMMSASDATGIEALQGQALTLTFDPRRNVPGFIRKDVTRNGWALPLPDVYPILAAINTPAGGVTRRQLRDLTAILHATAAFVRDFSATPVLDRSAFLWTHDATGVHLLLDAGELAVAVASREQPSLELAGPEGPGAEPIARIDPDAFDEAAEEERRVVPRYEEWLRARGEDADRSLDVSNAELFVNFLTQQQGIPLRAVTEYDLRVFLHDWVHRKVMLPDEMAEAVPQSLDRFFSFLAEREGIVCRWSQALLRDRALYWHRRRRFPGGFWWDAGVQEWRSELGSSLSARALIPESDDPNGVGGRATMGPVEAELCSELERLWLSWRDDLIRGGRSDRELVLKALLDRQATWERTPHQAAGGATPRAAIAVERRRGSNAPVPSPVSDAR